MQDLPLVSLITPSYNAAPYLVAAIESVLSQDYPHIEYLVMDGGSSDGTVDLLQKYAGRLRWFSGKDAGQADAIARGFAQTSGEIIGWLNADDVLKPGAVSAIVDAFRANPAASLIYGKADFIDAGGRFIGPCTVVEPYCRYRLIHYGDYIIQPAAFFTRQTYEAVGGLDSTLHWAMDWDLWIRLALTYEVVHIENDLASYRWLGTNKTADGGLKRLQEVEAVAKRYGCRGLPAYFRLELARLLVSQAGLAVKQGHLGQMLHKFGQATATILGSWNTIRCLVDPHVWRNYRTAQTLYRHIKKQTCSQG